MAIVIHSFPIPTPANVPSASKTIQLPVGAIVLWVTRVDGTALLVVRGDSTAAVEDRTFVAVRDDVPLSPALQAATPVGSFSGYTNAPGQVDLWHLFAL